MALTLATYNVLDLFDSADQRKIDALGAMVRELAADVIAFQEVGSLAALKAVLAAAGGGFGDPIVGRADKRGIACALVSKRPILDVRMLDAPSLPFPTFHEGDPEPFGDRILLRRAVPIVRIDGGDLGPLNVLSLHWKSGRPSSIVLRDGTERQPVTVAERAEGDLRSLVQRAAEALFLRRAIDELIQSRPGEGISVCGDFNDVSGSVPLQVICGEGEGSLHDVVERIPAAARISVLHGGSPAAIDHVLLTHALAGRVQSARFLNEQLADPDALPEGEQVLPSDHAPLVVVFA